MKKLLTTLFFMTLFVCGNAKDSTRSQAYGSVGLKGGLNASSFSPSRYKDYRVAYQIGISTQWQLAQYDYILVELLFSNEGDGSSLRTGYRNMLLPFLYKRDLNHWISIELGPQAALNIGQAPNNNFWGITFPPQNNLSLALCAGISGYVDDKNYFNFRYAKGVTPVFKNPNSFSSVFSLSFVKVF